MKIVYLSLRKISVDIILKYRHKNHNLNRSQNNVILEEIYFFVFLFFIIDWIDQLQTNLGFT